jgi:UPF0176 protein
LYRVLLYYKFVNIPDHESYAQTHLEFCNAYQLKGRIIVAPEGINGTVSGSYLQVQKYIDHMHSQPAFADLEFKEDVSEHHVFKTMHVRAKKEIVTFRADVDIDPNVFTGEYLEPDEWLNKMEKDDVIILDGRSDYEYDLGHFRNAVRPDVRSFREFPVWLEKNKSLFKNKKVLTYCTGGIRCEKLSAYMLKKGIKNVYQLHGGIIKYSKHPETKGKYFEGKCYVFDERISIPVNFADENKIVSKCHHCGTPTDRYVNCANLDCHLQHFECGSCEDEWLRSCSPECLNAPRNEFRLNS